MVRELAIHSIAKELTPDMTNTQSHPSDINSATVAVIGLGYVGLPLAVEFAKTRKVIGFDVNADRVDELQAGYDRTREVSPQELTQAKGLTVTHDSADLNRATVFIVTVPTPIDAHKRPDLTSLLNASKTVGAALKPGDIVIYESTVYPGATEEDCVPILESVSGLKFNRDFFCGYSPERINSGDKQHRLPDITKVVAGSTPEAADRIEALYASIITAGTYRAESICVAEAAKVIENTQRDINIALINELSVIFNKMGIDTEAVLRAAGTKWNFLPFRPGLVGGHCIGVDPYYLTHKAQALGYDPQVILAGRRINDGMGVYAAGQIVKAMLNKRIQVNGARVLLMGITFKENCPDLRNTRVTDIIKELRSYNVQVDLHDPVALPEEAEQQLNQPLCEPQENTYDGIILAVGHQAYRDWSAGQFRKLGKPDHVFFDLKSLLPADLSDLRL